MTRTVVNVFFISVVCLFCPLFLTQNTALSCAVTAQSVPYGVNSSGETVTTDACLDNYPGLNFSQAELYILRHQLDYLRYNYNAYRSTMFQHFEMFQDTSPYSDRVRLESLGPLYSEDYKKILQFASGSGSDPSAASLIEEAKEKINMEEIVATAGSELSSKLLEMAGVSIILMPLEKFKQCAQFLATATLDGLNAMMDNFYRGAAELYLFEAWESSQGDEIYNPYNTLEENADQTARVINGLTNTIDIIETADYQSSFSYRASSSENRAAWAALETALNNQKGLLDTLDSKAQTTRGEYGLGRSVVWQWTSKALQAVNMDPLSDAGDVNGDGVTEMLADAILLAWKMEIDSLRGTLDLQRELIDEYTVPELELLSFIDPNPDSEIDRYPVSDHGNLPAYTPSMPETPDWTVGPSGCDFTTIQAAVDAASPGDAIMVSAKDGGAYYEESVTIGKEGIVLYGSASALPYIGKPDGVAPLSFGIEIAADNVTVCNLIIQRTTRGIIVKGNGATVVNNLIQWVIYGILIEECHDGLFAGNIVDGAVGRAIRLERGAGNTLYYNSFNLKSDVADTACAYSSGANTWDDGVDRGNFWSDYDGSGIYPIADGREKDDRVYGAESVTPGETVIMKALVSGVMGDDAVAVDFYFGDPDNGGILLNASPVQAEIQGNYAVAVYEWDTAGFLGTQDIHARIHGAGDGVAEKVRVFPSGLWPSSAATLFVTGVHLEPGDDLTLFNALHWIDSPYESPGITVPDGASLSLSGVIFSVLENLTVSVAAEGAFFSHNDVNWNTDLDLFYRGERLLEEGFAPVVSNTSLNLEHSVINLRGCGNIDWQGRDFAGYEITLSDLTDLRMENVTADAVTITDCTFGVSAPGTITNAQIPLITLRNCDSFHITDSAFSGNGRIVLEQSIDNLQISGNTFTDIEGYAISGTAVTAGNLVVESNTFDNCFGCFSLSLESDTTGINVRENDITGLATAGYAGVYLNASTLLNNTDLTITGNTLVNSSAHTVKAVHLVNLDGGTVKDNIFTYVDYGLYLQGCRNITATVNRFLEGSDGYDSSGSTNNRWYENRLGNYWSGFLCETPNEANLQVFSCPYVNGFGVNDPYPLIRDRLIESVVAVPTTGRTEETSSGISWPNPRFEIQHDGNVVLDRLTGLMWCAEGNAIGDFCPGFDTDDVEGDGKITWARALNFINYVNSGNCGEISAGYTDWRLPHMNELESLWNTSSLTIKDFLENAGFPNMQSGRYWSSTTEYPDGYAYTVDFVTGEIISEYWHNCAYSLMVRGGAEGGPDPAYPANIAQTGQITSHMNGDDGDLQRGIAWPSDRFIDNGDGTITDVLTGLMWFAETGRSYTWQEIPSVMEALNNGTYPYDSNKGYSDWRLPSVQELLSLDCYFNVYPEGYLYPNGGIPDSVLLDYVWSATTRPDDTSKAYVMNLGDGQLISENKLDPHLAFIRFIPVRGGLYRPPAAPRLHMTPEAIDFGNVAMLDSRTELLEVRNGGINSAAIFLVSLIGEHADSFSLLSEPMPHSLIPGGESDTIEVVFNPTSPGEKQARLIIYSNDPITLWDEIPLRGTSTEHTVSIGFQGNGSGVIEAHSHYDNQTYSFSESGTLQVVPGTDVTFTATPAAGSHFDCWTGLPEDVSRSNPITVRINADTTVTATFALDTFTVRGSAATAGGAISPSGSVTVDYGQDQTFTFAADPHYFLSNVRVDGASVGTPDVYTFENISGDHSITADFTLIPYSIAASAGNGGAISPSGTLEMNVTQEQIFAITPEPGYAISDLLVDGVSRGALSSYTLSNPEENHIIEAVFETIEYAVSITHSGYGAIEPAGPLTMTVEDTETLLFTPDAHYWYVQDVLVNGQSQGASDVYEIAGVTENLNIQVIFETDWHRFEATAGEGGTVWPIGEYYVAPGGTRRVIITPDDGYLIADVVVDGVSLGAIDRYTFTNVDAGHSIEASFVAHDPLPLSLPRTGADISWYEGDDGDLQEGIEWPDPRFTDNGDGTITDNLTGLIWLKDSAALGAHSWENALAAIETLNTSPRSIAPTGYDGDYPDWRMPNQFELLSLFVNAGEAEISEWLARAGFTCGTSLWSSTNREDYYYHGAFYVESSANGFIYHRADTDDIKGVLVIRGTSTGPFTVPKTGQTISYRPGDDGDLQKGAAWPSPRFVDNGDGTVTDELTNRMWLKTAKPLLTYEPRMGDADGCADWGNTRLFVDKLNNGDYSEKKDPFDDWHLPNVWEFLSLFDASLSLPAFGGSRPFTDIDTGNSVGSVLRDDTYWTGTISPVDSSLGGVLLTIIDATVYSYDQRYYDWKELAGVSPFAAEATVVRDASKVTVHASVSGNGSISPSGDIRVDIDGSQTFTIAADAGHEISDVIVDGVSVGAVNSYTFENLTAPHTLEVQFAPLTYTITTGVTGNGSILPGGNQAVEYGQSLHLTFAPDYGSVVADVLVDGLSIGNPSYYIFDSVAEHHDVAVVFEEMSGQRAEAPATGQTVSYAAGDDGYNQSGVAWPEPRFVDNGDGTITDNLTGIMWLKHASLGTLERGWQHTWNGALAEVAAFNSDPASFAREEYTADYTDWRLPNIVELNSIFRNAGVADIKTWLESVGFVHVPTDNFWSSTTITLGQTTYAYYTSINSGMAIDRHLLSNPFYTWPVRGTASGAIYLPSTGQTVSYAVGDDGNLKKGLAWPDPRFIDNGNGTITDELTGLMWLKNADLASGEVDWQNALNTVAGVNNGSISGACGYRDWRLPTLSEQMSLIDWSAEYPPLPEGHPFVNLQTYLPYWTSTTDASSDSSAYIVDFSFAEIHSYPKTGSYSSDNYVMAVRNPYYRITYSPPTLTNQDVTAAITFSDETMTVTSEGGAIHVFTENGSWNFTFEDGENTTGTVTATVDWIDRSPPTATIAYSTTDPTNQAVVATITLSDGSVTSEGGATHTFTENGDWTFTFEDDLGNSGTASATVNWIDKAPPTATIAYSTVYSTNQDVTATLRPSETVTVTNNGGLDTYRFTENGTFTFSFEDAAGNTGTVEAAVDWIDRTPPTASIEYSPASSTFQNVDATITLSDGIVTSDGGATYTFRENGTWTFTYEDIAGNGGTAVATVDWIDRTPPTADIVYSTKDPTNQNVIATLQPNETVAVTNNGGLDTYTFVENGTFTFQFEDAAGNAGTAEAAVDWIDRTPPTATIVYSNTDLTNQDVVATISLSDGTVTSAGGDTHIFRENGVWTFTFEDAAGNTGAADAMVDWIDKEAPAYEISYTPSTPTNEDRVVATITLSDGSVTSDGGATHTFTENGTWVFEFADALGNTGTAEATVDWIDRTPPTAEIWYFTTDPTNQDVRAGLLISEPVTVTNNGGSGFYIFKENGTFEFQFVDAAGNAGAAVATVDWIDKEAPTCEISYTPSTSTNGDMVAATITLSDGAVTSDGGATHTFTENGTWVFEFADALGNTGTAVATVDWIDRMPPTASIVYSTTTPTNKDVTAALQPSEPVEVTNNGGLDTYSFVQNGTFTFTFKDAAGNTGEAVATVDWIDKTPPTATVTYSITEPTTQDVVATITLSDGAVTSDGGATHIFTENGPWNFTFEDALGNTGTVVAEVNWIDKEAPTCTISYNPATATNQDVVATIVLSDGTVTSDGGATHIFTRNGVWTFNFTDDLGNADTATAVVDWIDKTPPTATVSYSTVSLTNQDVVATITLSDGTVTSDGGSTHTFTENGDWTFAFTDSLGNTGTAEADVSWIDKEPPTATITYSTNDPTNQDVVATITLSDGTVTSEGGATHTFTENGTFTFEFKDEADNTGTAVAIVDWIDRTPPTATVLYSTTEPTNQDVVATLQPSEAVTITNNTGLNSYTFTQNGTFTFEFEDAAGNTGTAAAEVANIDKQLPTCEIRYIPETLTNQDVIATLTLSEGMVTSDGGATYTFRENGTWTFTFEDEAGNSGTAVATVDWIDKTPPTATVLYSTTEPTNQDVVATLQPDEDEVITILNNNGSSSYTFKENGTFTFEFTDDAGNAGIATAEVHNIVFLAGDVDGNGELTLADAILSMRACLGAGSNEMYNKKADVNNDQRIGIEEVIFILRSLAYGELP